MASATHNLSEAAQENQDWLARAGLLLESLVMDALRKAEFHGHVTIDVVIKGNRIIGIDPSTSQTIRK